MRLVERVGQLHKTTLRLLRREVATRTDRPFLQLKALKVIAHTPDGCTQALLADRLFIDAAAASRLVDRLVDEGLVRRTRSTDRRCVHLSTTRAATKDLAILDAAIAVVEDEFVALVGKRAAHELADAMGELADTLAAKTEEPAPPGPRARLRQRRA
jgi:MarR family transcriptional regulator, transcriptional regulator for hemolysin